MQTVEINHGDLKSCRNQFSKELKKSKSLVLFFCPSKKVAQIKLIEDKGLYTIDHYFEAEGFIKGNNCRHVEDIDRHIIKKLITPKADFCFQVWADGKSNQYTKESDLHSDMILLRVGDYELMFSSQTCKNNSARMTNY
jgi:hypothetical protein